MVLLLLVVIVDFGGDVDADVDADVDTDVVGVAVGIVDRDSKEERGSHGLLLVLHQSGSNGHPQATIHHLPSHANKQELLQHH